MSNAELLRKVGRVDEIQAAIVAPYLADDQVEASRIQDALTLIKDSASRVIHFAIAELNVELDDREESK